MGVAELCTVTVTGTVLGTIVVGPIVIVLPDTGTGLVDVTIPLPILGDFILVNIPCPTIDAISIVLGNVLDLSISVVHTP